MTRKPWMVCLVNDEGWTGGEFSTEELAHIAARAFVEEIDLQATVKSDDQRTTYVGHKGTVVVRPNVYLG